jgi:hypothetical protein
MLFYVDWPYMHQPLKPIEVNYQEKSTSHFISYRKTGKAGLSDSNVNVHVEEGDEISFLAQYNQLALNDAKKMYGEN